LSGGFRERYHGGWEEAGPDELTVGLAGKVALELADDLLAGLARSDPAGVVVLGAGIVAEAGDGDPPQRGVGLPVPAAVEPVPFVLARGAVDRADTA
jgi:hypothetical protein